MPGLKRAGLHQPATAPAPSGRPCPACPMCPGARHSRGCAATAATLSRTDVEPSPAERHELARIVWLPRMRPRAVWVAGTGLGNGRASSGASARPRTRPKVVLRPRRAASGRAAPSQAVAYYRLRSASCPFFREM